MYAADKLKDPTPFVARPWSMVPRHEKAYYAKIEDV